MITIGKNTYKIIKEEKNGFDIDAFKERFTDYFEPYDYIGRMESFA